jgi:uncharacterized membrane protein
MQANHAAEKRIVNIGDNERILSALAGSLLLYATAKKHTVNSLLLLGGGYLLYRAVSGHCSVRQVLGVSAARGHREESEVEEIKVRAELVINRPRAEVYAFWRRLENLPLFMRHLEHVDELNAKTSAWKLKLPGGTGDIRWEARILKEEEGKEFSWHSVAGAPIENTGKINFADTPAQGTRVDIMIVYRHPEGVVSEGMAQLLSQAFRAKVEDDVRRFKDYFENEFATGVNGHIH